MALNLFGVIYNDVHHTSAPVAGTQLIVVRDLAAIVADGPYAPVEPSDERVAQVTEVIAAYAHPRDRAFPRRWEWCSAREMRCSRWLELHYVALSDALSFVDGRDVGRVHVWRPTSA